MAKGIVRNGGSGNDFLWAQGQLFADVRGGDDDDNVLIANNVGSTIDTGEGNDFLRIGGTVVSATAATGGGSDSITVDDGPVILDAGAGSDQIVIRNTGQQQIVTTGADRDVIIPIDFSANGLVITDFTPGPNGDWIEYSNIVFTFVNWDGASNLFATGHVRLSQVGADTHFEVDVTGGGDGADFVSAIVLQNVAIGDLTATNFVPSFDLGGSPDVTLIGSDGVDGLNGGPGNDTILGMGGDDFLRGNDGNDYIEDNEGFNFIEGGGGDDTIVSTSAAFSGASTFAFTGEGINMVSIEGGSSASVFGGGGADTIHVARSSSVSIQAGDGNNAITSLDNTSVFITGGNDADFIDLFGGNAQVDTAGGADQVLLLGFSNNIVLGDGDDALTTLAGTALQNSITTGNGSDTIRLGSTEIDSVWLWDFTAGPGGDVLDLGALIAGPVTASNVSEYLSLTEAGLGLTLLSLDVDGASGPASFFHALTFVNTPGLDVVNLFNDGNVVVL